MFILRVLGGAFLEGTNGRVKGPAAQRRRIALLALLARTRGRPLGREKLIGYLWPDHPTDAARHLLAQALYAVRKAMPEDPFITPGDEIALHERVLTSDANAFDDALAAGDLEGAVALYWGDFLDGFFVPRAGEFERWVEDERNHLRRAQGRALEQLAECAETEEDPLRAAGWWQRASEHDPYSSRLVLHLMRALEWGGEHLAAIRAAEKHADFLREDIGASPDPEVLAYAERLRTNPPAGRLAPVPAAPPSPPEAATPDDLPRTVRDGITTDPDGGAAQGVPGEATVVAEPALQTSPAHIETARSLPRPAVLLGVPLAILIVAIALLALLRRTPEPIPVAPERAPLDPRRVAVLYFDHLSEHGDAEHIATGLTETLIHELSQVRSLDVISRNGVKPYRGTAVPFDSIVAALKVGSLVEGSVQRSGGRVRVTVQLIDGSTGTHLQSRTLVRPLGELFALEDEVGAEVSRFLRMRLGEEIRLRERGAGARDAETLEAVMRAEELRSRTERGAGEPDPLGPAATIRTLQRADSLLAVAEEAADSRWVEPLVLRGWVALGIADALPQTQRTPHLARALSYAERTLAMRPGEPGALELRGTARWRLARLDAAGPHGEMQRLLASVERDLKMALETDPARATAWSTLSQFLRLQGRLAEADVAARRALEEDEFLADADQILERLYRSTVTLGRYRDATHWCEEGARRFPTNWRFVECRLTLLGYDRVTSREITRAWELYHQLEQLDPPGHARADARPYSPLYREMTVAHVLARGALKDSARALVARARRSAGRDPALLLSLAHDEARVQYLLGDTVATLRLLGEYVRGKPRLRDYIARDPNFAELRQDPRFKAIIKPAALSQDGRY